MDAITVEALADWVGFEPTKGFHGWRFSRPLPSTTRPRFRTFRIPTIVRQVVYDTFRKDTLWSRDRRKRFFSVRGISFEKNILLVAACGTEIPKRGSTPGNLGPFPSGKKPLILVDRGIVI